MRNIWIKFPSKTHIFINSIEFFGKSLFILPISKYLETFENCFQTLKVTGYLLFYKQKRKKEKNYKVTSTEIITKWIGL